MAADPVLAFVGKAKRRFDAAGRAVTLLQAEVSRQNLVKSEAATAEQLQSVLADRMRELDEARSAYEALKDQPRWKLEQIVAADSGEKVGD